MDSTTRNNTKAPASTKALRDLNGERRRRASDTRKALDVAREALAEARARLEANTNHVDMTAVSLTLEVLGDQLDVVERHMAGMVLEMQAGTNTERPAVCRREHDPFESKEKYALVVALLTTSLIATLFALVYKSTEK